MNSRLQFKARFRRHFDVREILAEDKFVDNIVEHMWMAWQASREALVVELPCSSSLSASDDPREVLYACQDAIKCAGIKYK